MAMSKGKGKTDRCQLSLLDFLRRAAGLFTMPGPEALRAEIQRYAEEERRARAEKRKREMFLQEMEG